MHSCSIIVLFQRLTQSADVELAESEVSPYDMKPSMCAASAGCRDAALYDLPQRLQWT